jgi:ABC-type nickel/cobalt efflux system permease component RcnA
VVEHWIDVSAALHGGGWIAFGGAVLLGLRHVGDPDHLTAVATLAVSDPRAGARRAGWLGLAWGAGHAVTFLALGVGVIAIGRALPAPVRSALEVMVGVVIAALALRLLWRWWRGLLHSHPHSHGDVHHSHPHLHEPRHGRPATERHRHDRHDHRHRSPLTAFGVGLLHGAGGSAAIGVLVLGAFAEVGPALSALVLIALATTAAMTLFSAALGSAVASPRLAAGFERLVPAFGVAALAFGMWYAMAPVLEAGALP